jgi:hypothetical protein
VAGGLLPWAWFLVRDRLGVVTDVIAILLPLLAVLTALAVGILGRRRRGAVVFAISTVLVGVVAVVGPWIPHGSGSVDPARAVRIAAANIGAGELEGAGDLLALNADVLVVSEIGEPLTERLSAEFPNHVSDWNGPAVAVFSRWPLQVLERPGPDLSGFMVRVQAPAGEFDLIAAHVPRPWWSTGGSTYDSPADRGGPYQTTVAGHHRQIEQLAQRVDRAQRDGRNVVVTGDLNTTDRGRDYRILTRNLHDAMLDGWGRPTEIGRWRPLLVRIDHLFTSPGWCADDAAWHTVPASDHHGLTATIGPCRT